MLQVERHYHKGNDSIIALCKTSKELYNKCNFFMRQPRPRTVHAVVMPDDAEVLKIVKRLWYLRKRIAQRKETMVSTQPSRSLAGIVAATVRGIAQNPAMLEVGRKAIEDVLVDYRDSRISLMRGNGLVIREADGSESSIIRLGPEDALRIGLKAIGEYVAANGETALTSDA